MGTECDVLLKDVKVGDPDGQARGSGPIERVAVKLADGVADAAL